MKKLILVLLALLLLCACGNQKNEKEESKISIGVLQLMEHESLNQAYDGFKDALKTGGYDESNVEFVFQNPNNDKSSLATMAQVLVNHECKLILAIGTASAQALLQETKEVPILGTAITDYVDVGLVASNTHPGGNLSGSSDYVDMQVQLDLIEMFVPEVKTLGLLYTSSEENSIIQANAMKEVCAKRNIEVVEKTISDLTMVNDTMMAFVGHIDALYIPTDNPIASSMASVDIVAKENYIPVFTGWDEGVKNGALASVGVNYYNLGYQTGLDAVKLLNGEIQIGDLPIYFTDSSNAQIYYNSETLNHLGLQMSEEISAKGIDLSQN